MTVLSVPYSSFPFYSSLFERYSSDYGSIAGFYNGDFRSTGARYLAAERAASHPRDRQVLVEVLLDQNIMWGLDEATKHRIKRLHEPDSVAVVTGQQVGLFSGPLYTIYKAVTAIQLAKKMEEETRRPVVPVFWLGGEDHDFDEVAGTTVMSRNQPVTVRYNGYTPPDDGNGGPVGRMVLNADIDRVTARIDDLLPSTGFKRNVLALIRDTYQPGNTLSDAFARLLRVLFEGTGLVFLNADDVRLKKLVMPLFQREIEDCVSISARLQATCKKLEERFHAQVHATPTNLFLFTEAGRLPIDFDDDVYRIRGTNLSYTRSDLLQLLAEHPERFSPNVVLRPLVQDTLLPTAAYVAGPGEIAYYAQYKPVYEWAGVPMPVIYPRAGVSVIGSRVNKTLDKYGLSIQDFDTDFERFFRRFVLERLEVDVDQMFDSSKYVLREAIDSLRPDLERVDQTLLKSAESTRVAMEKEMDRLKGRVVKAEKRNQEVAYGQLEKVFAQIYPNGNMQDRVLSILDMLNRYGFDFINVLLTHLSLDTTSLQVLTPEGFSNLS